jgi:hypothetical protein
MSAAWPSELQAISAANRNIALRIVSSGCHCRA